MNKKQSQRMVIYPLIGIIIIHFIFSYSNWAFSPEKWENGAASLAGFLHLVVIILGVIIGYNQEK